jgi:hypothetical protein
LKFGNHEAIFFGVKNVESFRRFDDFDLARLEVLDEDSQIVARLDIFAHKNALDELWMGFE